MKRLFISLYLAVTLALLFIGWGSEFIWQQTQHNSDRHIHQLAQLATLAANQPDSANQLAKLSQRSDIPTEIFSSDDIQLLPQQHKMLESGKAVVSYGNEDQLFIYIKQQQQLLQFGPISTANQSDLDKSLIQLASYAFLALAILVWSWPLWRDMSRLKALALEYGVGNFSARDNISDASVVAPIKHSFVKMAEQIATMIEEQKHMFNAVSHDIRTPLARLKFSTALLQNQQPKNCQEMNQDIAEIEQLVDEILQYARLEGQLELDISQVNLTQLLENLVSKLARNSTNKLVVNLSQDIVYHCDGNLIERACQNIIVNALRHCSTQVSVSLEKPQGAKQIDIIVEDDGRGIADADIEKVFRPFARLESSRNKSSGGYGLGLAIVNKVMQWHQGHCVVEKSNQGGAKFRLVLPVR